MLVLVGHGLYTLLNKELYKRFMQVQVGPCWTLNSVLYKMFKQVHVVPCWLWFPLGLELSVEKGMIKRFMQVHDGPQWMWKLVLQFLFVPLGHIGPYWENGVLLDRTF